jgi:hypothetical protein
MMNDLLNLLKSAAPALATAVAGPMGGMAVKAIADKLGVPASITDVTNALQANPDLALKLKEIDTRAFEAETKAVTDRWQADMASDSWLSKNIRPGTLVYILTAYLGFAVADGFGFRISESYVQLLGQWGMLVMTAYFGGRSAEKIVGVLKGNK